MKKNGHSSDEDIKEAKALSEAMNSSVIGALIDLGKIDENKICEAFCSSYGLQRSKVKLSELKTRPLPEKITDQFILINRIIPIDSVDDKVYVAVADPSALESFNSLQVMSNTDLVESSVVGLSEMQNYLDKLKAKMDDDFLQSLAAAENDETGAAKMELMQGNLGGDNNGGIPDYLLENQEEKATTRKKLSAGNDVIEFIDNVISNAITLGVSDIHIESFRNEAQVRYRKDGVLQVLEEFSEFLELLITVCFN